MSRYLFELAGPDDDADLRHVLASTPMEGRVAVGFRREPSWFAAAEVDGFFRQVVACLDRDTGRIFGFGCRSLRALYVNGRAATVGYLSNLRVLEEYRNFGHVARGYAFFRRLHQDGRTPFYLTTIAEGNETALRVLTSGRAGLPGYHPAGRYHTLSIPLSRRVRSVSTAGVRTATAGDVAGLVAFLNEEGSRRQFFPVYRVEDFASLTPTGKVSQGLLRGLDLDRVLIAECDGSIVGVMAGWDQHEFRQLVVHGYQGWLRWLRPVYNAHAWLRGRHGLPAPGASLRTVLASLVAIKDDDPEVFGTLLHELRRRSGGGPASHLLVGLHNTDPLLPTARRFTADSYTTLLYLVCWADGAAARTALDDRPVYLELGSL